MNKESCIMVPVASATNWPRFRKDMVDTGWTIDCAPIYGPSTLAWSYGVDGWVDTTPIAGCDQVFVLSSKGRLYAFNAKTGVKNCDHQYPSATGTFELSVPAYHDEIVYVATSRGALNQGYCMVTALHARSGSGNERENITLKMTCGYQLNTLITYDNSGIYLVDWNGSSTTTNDTGTYWCLDASDVWNGPETEITET